MKKLLFFLLLIFLAFSFSNFDIGQFLLMATNSKSHNKIQNDQQKTNETTQDNKKREFDYKPESTVERVVTNVISDFVKTPQGAHIASKMIKPEFEHNVSSNFVYKTFGFKGYEKKYEKYIVRSSAGDQTICGQKIKAQILITDRKGEILKNKSIDYVLGYSEYEEFNILPIGLTSSSLFKSKFLTFDNNHAFEINPGGNKLSLSIVKHLTNYDKKILNIDYFDHFISNAKPALCGDNIKFFYTVTDIDNKRLYASEMNTKIGSINNTNTLNYLITNLNLTGMRTIYAKIDDLISGDKDNFLPKSFKFKKGQVVRVIIDKVQIAPRNPEKEDLLK